ncbi:MAG TPA: hypothetical protein EYG82_03615 [Sulfurovum sp.]|nr:hypothetical protein [Sulfurovum sp.]
MMIRGFNILKSNKFFLVVAVGGLAYMGLDKGAMSDSAVVTQVKEYNVVKEYKKSISTSGEPSKRDEIYDLEIVNNIGSDTKMEENKANILSKNTINADYIMGNGIDVDESINEEEQFKRGKDIADYTERAHMASMMMMDNSNYNNEKMIRTSRNHYVSKNQEATSNHPAVGEEIAEDTTSEEEDLKKANIEENAKVSDHSNAGASDYITGSAIPSVENNTTNATSASPQSMVFLGGNKSDFPQGTDESLHDCYIDTSGQMQCRNSIISCREKDELGLDCFVTYYENGIWHNDPSHLTITSNEEWIRKHLETKTTFAHSKFENYYDDRYADTSLIQPDLNGTRRVKFMKQQTNHQEVNTTLDMGIGLLMENNNTRTNDSILTRGTRFGTGSEHIDEANPEILEALKEFLSSFVHVDDSDVYEVLEYWTLMDDKYRMGDNEDFALTAMEWLLLNGVDPKYITLTEMKSSRTDANDIVLVIDSKEESGQKWIVKESDVMMIEEVYPNGYEDLIINAYKYID